MAKAPTSATEILDALRLRIDRARWWALQNHPFYGALSANLVDTFATVIVIPSTGQSQPIDTAATDGKRIFWNPGFISKLTDEELRFVLLHETLHPAHLHLWRLPRNAKGNRAGDFVINKILSTLDGIKMPKGGLLDPQYDGLAEEEIYRRLPEEQGGGQGGQGGQDGGNDPGGCGGFLPPARNDDESDKKDNKNGDQPKQDGQKSKGKGPQGGSDKDGDTTDSNADGGDSDSNLEDSLEDHWKRAIEQARIIHKTTQKGNFPADLERILDRVKAQHIDWRRETIDFAHDVVSTKNDWTRSAKRHAWQKVIYPRRYKDALGTVVFVRDTSGSITHELSAQHAACVDSCIAETGCEALVIDVDTRIHKEYRLGPGDECPRKAHGCGGTDFREPFARVRELQDNGEKIAGLVYFTDGYGEEPTEEEVTVPTLWLLVGAGHRRDVMRTGRTLFVEE